MAVEAIGSTLGTETSSLSSTTLDQEDFLRLFLTELNFQDPLEPIDNREFLAQIAQFAGLEQDRQTTERVDDLVLVNSSSQSVGLLGKTIDFNGDGVLISGQVTAVSYSSEGARLTVDTGDSSFITDVRLSQISRVQN